MSMAERRGLIDSTHSLSVRAQCELLKVSRSVLYYHPVTVEDDIQLLNQIREIWQSRPFYGYRKITAVLRQDHQKLVNRKRVQRLMQIGGIQALHPKKNLSARRREDTVQGYLLKDLDIISANQVWMVDITYLKLKSRFVYLVAIIDVYSRYVVGWNLSYDLSTENSVEALRTGLLLGSPHIVNSDQGCQYTSEMWIKTLTQLDICISHDGVGRWADNIYIERFWRSIKYEALGLNDWEDFGQLYLEVRNYIDFYNHQRPHQALGYKTPATIYKKGSCVEVNSIRMGKKKTVKQG